jgi:hypothetical protein
MLLSVCIGISKALQRPQIVGVVSCADLDSISCILVRHLCYQAAFHETTSRNRCVSRHSFHG